MRLFEARMCSTIRGSFLICTEATAPQSSLIRRPPPQAMAYCSGAAKRPFLRIRPMSWAENAR